MRVRVCEPKRRRGTLRQTNDAAAAAVRLSVCLGLCVCVYVCGLVCVCVLFPLPLLFVSVLCGLTSVGNGGARGGPGWLSRAELSGSAAAVARRDRQSDSQAVTQVRNN